ncbi:gamma-glutamyl-gamma-aminobutyrate hydrolase family protein [Streptomyces sp. JJ38]|uniref:gamma-glutamyl-gamma-aminobutyrate hydrolase family protein n=1 Tax=Streptomyces sp. JJ38 TaxID=2738128 RepID=UPI001C55F939|nr:gamma-glutamyl-gamma-aminobutyrate hydrolase family protein [Streptomyces sp. JJ38]MBW1599383.1 gamma-glutamyl-gamma-aminobutyrate hydrolase family protein [Streptomyces sp. JJ38]
MTGPLIGLSTYLVDSARWSSWDLPAALLPADYHRMVQRVGGLAVLLPPDPALGAARAAVARLDGLVVSGGADLDPAGYGAAPDPRTGPVEPGRDAFELALVAAALERGLPVLGVCRGLQILNVALGGTLLQHVDGHRGAPGTFLDHPVTPVPGTLLHSLLGGPVTVPSCHHQAVDRLGEGLVACALAADGLVEAAEADPAADSAASASPFVLGVQWHAEAGVCHRVVAAFVEAAARGREARAGHGGHRRPSASLSAASSTAGASVSDGPYQVR